MADDSSPGKNGGNTHPAGGAHVGGDVSTGGGMFVGRDNIHKQITEITANNVALRDQYIIVGGESIRLPSPRSLLAYLVHVRDTHKRWADQPDEPAPALFDQSDQAHAGPDAYLLVDAMPLPMRVAEFRLVSGGAEPQTHELLTAVGSLQHTVILGEPGSGKTTALERLAWATANASLTRAANGRDKSLVVPIFARLAAYHGEADLLPMLRRVLSRSGIPLPMGGTRLPGGAAAWGGGGRPPPPQAAAPPGRQTA